MPESTLFPSQGLRIWPQALGERKNDKRKGGRGTMMLRRREGRTEKRVERRRGREGKKEER